MVCVGPPWSPRVPSTGLPPMMLVVALLNAAAGLTSGSPLSTVLPEMIVLITIAVKGL